MACLNDHEAAAFGPMLSEQSSSLPNLRFRAEISDLVSAVNALGDAVELRIPPMSNKEATEKTIVNQVIASYDNLKKCPQHKTLFVPINQLANSIGQSIVTVFNTLKTSVKPEVDVLRESVMGRTTEILENDHNFKTIEGNLVAADPKFNGEVIKWDEVLGIVGGQSVVTDAYKDIAGLESTGNLTDTQIALNTLRPAIMAMNLHQKTSEDMRQRMIAWDRKGRMSADTDIAQERLDNIYNLCTDPYTFDAMVAGQLKAAANTSNFGALLQANLTAIRELYPALQSFKSTPFNISDEVSEQLFANIGMIEKVMWLICNQIVAFRKYYNDTLIISETQLNGDRYDEYLQQGGSDTDIASFLAANYTGRNIPVPTKGIPAGEVIADKENYNKTISEQKAAATMGLATLKAAAMTKAVREVLIDHLTATDATRLPDGMDIEQFVGLKKSLIERVTNQLDTANDAYLENSLYDFVITLWFDGTMVQSAHKLFGAEMVKQLTIRPEMKEADLALVDTQVASTIVSQFLMNNICKVG